MKHAGLQYLTTGKQFIKLLKLNLTKFYCFSGVFLSDVFRNKQVELHFNVVKF